MFYFFHKTINSTTENQRWITIKKIKKDVNLSHLFYKILYYFCQHLIVLGEKTNKVFFGFLFLKHGRLNHVWDDEYRFIYLNNLYNHQLKVLYTT